MGPPQVVISDDISSNPFDLADPNRKSACVPANYSHEISQMVANGEFRISPILPTTDHHASPTHPVARPQEFGGLSTSHDAGESTAKFDDEESVIAYQEMIKNIN